ncbi:GNAT family N-acetyltransferase [Candidatus Parcubacteria bacterium]|nr:GNAT family N-acetyltransferase [Candidatus Parcubacteria bacterium]
MASIRYYKDSDYEEVKQTLQEGGLYDDIWEDRVNLEHKIKRDPESILLAIDDEKIVGCVFVVEDGWNAFIWRLSVREEHRKQGIGKMLVEKAEEIIKGRGIKESSIFVNAQNDELKKWYESQGYLKTSDYTFMYKKLDN